MNGSFNELDNVTRGASVNIDHNQDEVYSVYNAIINAVYLSQLHSKCIPVYLYFQVVTALVSLKCLEGKVDF